MLSPGRFIIWTPPNRGMRLAASALMAKLLPADMGVIGRVVADMDRPAQLASWLRTRREDAGGVNRYREERYLLALEARRKATGLAKISNEDLIQLRRDGIGLNAESTLMTIWEQCAARWHARELREIPRSVKLILTGAPNLEAIEEDVAVLLAEDAYLRRRRALPPDRFPNLREDIIRQWVTASGGIQRHLDVVDRMLGRDKDHRLAELAADGGYATLAPEMVDVARQLAQGNQRLAYFVFRCMQRIAACSVDGEVMWLAEWLRGPSMNSNAILGTTGKPRLVEIVRDDLLGEVTKGHSGAAAIATTYRVRLPILTGTCGPQYAAQVLGIALNSKGMPRRPRG